MLKYYEFIEKVNEAGFWNRFANYVNPEIFIYGTEMGQCYTGNPETDTVIWNTRAAQEKKLACGYFFNGKPGGYIAPHFYSIFIDAFRPQMTVEERYKLGKLGKYELKIWTLLNKVDRPMAWHEFGQYYGIKSKEEKGKLDSALKCLQMTFDVTVSGVFESLQKNGKTRECIAYDKVDKWVPPEWMKMNPHMEHKEALETIYHQSEKISSIGNAKKAFSKSLKLYKTFC